MDFSRYQSWGRLSPHKPKAVIRPAWPTDIDWGRMVTPVLPFGLGRSYGDTCLNDGGTLIDATGLNRLIGFDAQTGVLHCMAGVTLAEILRIFLPKGWFLPVTPGTKFVTVGGAIANDIHGKNHHRQGTFGCCVEEMTLVRSSGDFLTLNPLRNAELFSATIGGLGLTGLILAAKIRLRKVMSSLIAAETVKFDRLDEFFELSAASDSGYEYTVAWIDALADGSALGRGHFIRGNHHDAPSAECAAPPAEPRYRVPVNCPSRLINRFTVAGFNAFYFNRHREKFNRRLLPPDPFFYPLDAVANWNRLYGGKGFYQYQLVIPREHGVKAVRAMLALIAATGLSSPLTVLKIFGDRPSPGMLSFPMPGVTLAVDFPNRGKKTAALFSALDELVLKNGGRLYPAKDARMRRDMFRASCPRWREFAEYIDPAFSSNFLRRVNP